MRTFFLWGVYLKYKYHWISRWSICSNLVFFKAKVTILLLWFIVTIIQSINNNLWNMTFAIYLNKIKVQKCTLLYFDNTYLHYIITSIDTIDNRTQLNQTARRFCNTEWKKYKQLIKYYILFIIYSCSCHTVDSRVWRRLVPVGYASSSCVIYAHLSALRRQPQPKSKVGQGAPPSSSNWLVYQTNQKPNLNC